MDYADYRLFLVDGQQLLYLMKHDCIPYPSLDSETIWNKNKAAGFAWPITPIQINWLSVQCKGHGIQHLTLWTSNLLMINMIFSALYIISITGIRNPSGMYKLVSSCEQTPPPFCPRYLSDLGIKIREP